MQQFTSTPLETMLRLTFQLYDQAMATICRFFHRQLFPTQLTSTNYSFYQLLNGSGGSDGVSAGLQGNCTYGER
jgi:hypothetical protein